MQTNSKFYRVDRKKIAFIKFIFEAYEGIAVISTIDRFKGIITLHIPPGCETDVKAVVDDLKQDLLIEEMTAAQITD